MSHPTSPSDIAREVIKALAAHKVSPTPENYARVYQKIAGTTSTVGGANQVLVDIAQHLTREAPKAPIGPALKEAAEAQDWTRYQAELQSYLLPSDNQSKPALAWPTLIRDLLRQLEIPHKGITISRKKEGLETVLGKFSTNQNTLFEKLQKLVRSWSGPTSTGTAETIPDPAGTNTLPDTTPGTQLPGLPPAPASTNTKAELMAQLQELLAQSLESSITLQPELENEIRTLAQQLRATRDHAEITLIAKQLRQFWIKQELRGGDKIKIQEGLVRLLRLLVENVGELVADDQWLHGQIATLQQIIESAPDRRSIADAERNLRDAIIKQSTLKQSLTEAKATLKSLMTTFIDRMGELAESTGEFHDKMAGYNQKIVSTDNLPALSHILEDIMHDTRTIQTSVMRSHEELLTARKQAVEAGDRISQLENELAQVSELVHEDQLTGALNRRGLDETLERESGRADRSNSPLSIALLDIDNFKRLNDAFGHHAGDSALVHLAKVIQESLRPSDAVARYGGEEFIIVLPDTGLEEAMETTLRLQRELTRKFFLHNNERLLVTFSAGVTLRAKDEAVYDVIGRADKAMYQAKQAGKNRVVKAE